MATVDFKKPWIRAQRSYILAADFSAASVMTVKAHKGVTVSLATNAFEDALLLSLCFLSA